ncbi:hypothetical protein SAY87_021224 [Trapa incisa]|uniref:DC1 domain-containing protein n=1 Tax=Trapa incisa TaxID=236973 RepID=A0AAN7JRU1_9MYRT|nr:hypothetical protein SAY87_021222 [Trapa incisa]KAK4752426.1 hypothetical protein SAY87_021224 [Trapa incisa]
MNFRPINCDLCSGAVNNSYWYYRCSLCDYDAHLGCADTINLPGHSQESRPPSTGPVIQQPPLLQVASPANFLNRRQGMTSNFLNNLFGSIGRRTRDAIMEVVTAEASDAHENNVNFYHHHGGVNNYEDDGSHQPPGSSGWGSLDTFSGGGDDNGG